MSINKIISMVNQYKIYEFMNLVVFTTFEPNIQWVKKNIIFTVFILLHLYFLIHIVLIFININILLSIPIILIGSVCLLHVTRISICIICVYIIVIMFCIGINLIIFSTFGYIPIAIKMICNIIDGCTHHIHEYVCEKYPILFIFLFPIVILPYIIVILDNLSDYIIYIFDYMHNIGMFLSQFYTLSEFKGNKNDFILL